MDSQPRLLSTPVLLHIAQTIQVPLKGLTATLELLDGGATVPFIARYRKEVTGNLDEVQIRAVEEKAAYFRELEDRRETVLSTIAEQGKLTPELKARIEATLDKTELEDLYLPYKPKRKTKASIARDRGLEPLAQFIWNQEAGPQTLDEFAATFTGEEVPDAAAALEGARHIIAEWISETADFRKHLRTTLLGSGVVAAKAIEGVQDPEGKFKMYASWSEPAAKVPSHRMLAIRRGAKEGFLTFEIQIDRDVSVTYLKNRVIKTQGECTQQLEAAVEDSWDRLLSPSIQTEVRLELKDRAEEEAIKVFRANLEALLLSAPAGSLRVLAIDPGIRTGCKVAVVDATGKYIENAVIYPFEPRNDVSGASRTLAALVDRHQIQAIAIGNGTASRETQALVHQFLRDTNRSDVFSVVVSESGASVYSASDVARAEFPDLDLTVRGAISIGRRLQDPLAELVKVDPKSIGVGQYQHDVDQKKLRQSLEGAVESCVNRVGVDLNTASFSLLKYVAGITERTALKIVEHRNTNGAFRSRATLLDVAGFGPKTFEQAAGFLRIRNGDNPLDMTAVHPESYPVVEQIAASLKVAIHDLVRDPSLIERANFDAFKGNAGEFTLADIREELRKPGRDPRDQFVAPKWRDDVREIADLKPGMIVEGTVTNVTNFGAFVDVGVHQDGLVHVSEISTRFIKDPREAVKVGQIVKAKVLAADPKAKRIALSIKQVDAPSERTRSKPAVADQLAALNSRFRVR